MWWASNNSWNAGRLGNSSTALEDWRWIADGVYRYIIHIDTKLSCLENQVFVIYVVIFWNNFRLNDMTGMVREVQWVRTVMFFCIFPPLIVQWKSMGPVMLFLNVDSCAMLVHQPICAMFTWGSIYMFQQTKKNSPTRKKNKVWRSLTSSNSTLHRAFTKPQFNGQVVPPRVENITL